MFTPRADVSAKLALQCSTITSSAFMEAHCVGNEQPGGRAVGRATPERTRSVPSVESIAPRREKCRWNRALEGRPETRSQSRSECETQGRVEGP